MEGLRLLGFFTQIVAGVYTGPAENAFDLINNGELGPFDALGFVFGRTHHHVDARHRTHLGAGGTSGTAIIQNKNSIRHFKSVSCRVIWLPISWLFLRGSPLQFVPRLFEAAGFSFWPQS